MAVISDSADARCSRIDPLRRGMAKRSFTCQSDQPVIRLTLPTGGCGGGGGVGVASSMIAPQLRPQKFLDFDTPALIAEDRSAPNLPPMAGIRSALLRSSGRRRGHMPSPASLRARRV